MATLQGKAVKNTYRQVLQIGANNVGVSGTLQPVQDGSGTNTALSLSTIAATVNGDLTVTGDLIITGGGLQIKELIDDTVADLIKNGTGITWSYNDATNTLTGNFTGTTSVVAEGTNLYFTNARSRTAISETITGIDYNNTTGVFSLTSGYTIPTTAAFNGKVPYTGATADVDLGTYDLKTAKLWLLDEVATGFGSIHLADNSMHFEDADGHTMFDIEDGFIQIHKDATIQSNLFVSNLTATRDHYLPNASGTIALTSNINYPVTSVFGRTGAITADAGDYTTTKVTEGTNLYYTQGRFDSAFAAKSTTNLAEGSNLYYTQARFDTAFSNKTTTNLAEGTNLYYTTARFNTALATKTTTDLAEGTNLYYTDTRTRLALSSSATGLTYANNSGIFSLTAGYAIPTTVKLGEYDIAYNRSLTSAAVTGTSTKTLTLNQQSGSTITASWTDQGITTINGTANQIAASTVGNTTTIGFTNDVTMPNNLIVSGNLTINGTATYVNTQSISAKDPLFEVANDNNTTDAVDIGYYGRYYDTPQTRIEFTGLFRDASDAGKFKFFTGLVDEPTNVVNTSGTGYTVGTLVANFEGNLAGTANAANQLSTARSISATGDAAWTVNFDGSANATAALTLANTGVTATTYGTSTAVPTIAIDSKGRITSASNTNIAFPVTTVNGASGTVVLTTTNIAEGTNQYFTTVRAQSAISGTAPISVTSGVVSISQASGATNGYLSSTDFTTFNSKSPAAGSTSITTLGTITAGTWNGTSIGAAYGGTGLNSYTIGDILYASGTSTLSKLADVATGNALISGGVGVAPSWGKIALTTHVSGTLPVANGGTGSASQNFVDLTTTQSIGGAKTFTSALAGTSANFSVNVGIGNTASCPLDVTADNSNAINLRLRGRVLDNVGQMEFWNNAQSTRYGYIAADSASMGMVTTQAIPLVLGTNSAVRISIASSGDVTFSNTIITNTPLAIKLNYAGSVNDIQLSAGTPLRIVNQAYDVALFQLTNTGAATFSSSVTLARPSSGATLLSLNGSSAYGDNSTLALCDSRSSIKSTILVTANGDTDMAFATQAGGVVATRLYIAGNGNIETYYNTTIKASLFVGNPAAAGATNITLQNNSNGYQFGINAACTQFQFSNGAPTVVATISGSSGVYTPLSDVNKKKDFEASTIGLKEVLQLKPTLYRFKDGEENAEKELGFIAQEVKEFIPQAYVESGEGEDVFIGLQDRPIIAALVKAVQEQQAQIEELKALIAAK